MNLLRDILNEKGTISAMRIMSFISLFTAVGIAIAGICKEAPDYSGLSILCGAFLSAAFLGKIGQKSVEANGVKTVEKA